MALLPIAATALKYLPAVTAVGGAIPGLQRGNLGEAALGAGTGALTGWGLKAPIAGLTGAGMRFAGSKGAVDAATGLVGKVAPNMVDAPIRQMLVSGAKAGIPLAGTIGGLGLSGAFSGMANQGANRALGAGSGIIGYNAVTGEPIMAAGAAVPPGLGQFGGNNMYGSNPYDIIDPNSPFSANRLMQRKQAETSRDNINTIAPTLLKWSEETKRRDLERQLAAAGIRQNIITQAGMLQAANQAGLNQGTTALQQVGGAMTNNYSYS